LIINFAVPAEPPCPEEPPDEEPPEDEELDPLPLLLEPVPVPPVGGWVGADSAHPNEDATTGAASSIALNIHCHRFMIVPPLQDNSADEPKFPKIRPSERRLRHHADIRGCLMGSTGHLNALFGSAIGQGGEFRCRTRHLLGGLGKLADTGKEAFIEFANAGFGALVAALAAAGGEVALFGEALGDDGCIAEPINRARHRADFIAGGADFEIDVGIAPAQGIERLNGIA
jgi:hypothetical protein